MILASVTAIVLIIVAVLVAFVVLAFGALLFLSSRMVKAVDASMAEDAKDPAKAWAQVAFGFINFRDPAYLSGDIACQAGLKRDWSIESPEALLQRAENLQQMLSDNPAWHGARLINMLRIGAGAGYITGEESWRRATEVARELQPAYGTWEEFAQAMLDALNERQGEWVVGARQTFNENLERLRRCDFRGVPYDTTFQAGPPLL